MNKEAEQKRYFDRYPLMGPDPAVTIHACTNQQILVDELRLLPHDVLTKARRDTSEFLKATGFRSIKSINRFYSEKVNGLKQNGDHASVVEMLTARRSVQSSINKYYSQKLGISEESVERELHKGMATAIGQIDEGRKMLGTEADQYNIAGDIRTAAHPETLAYIIFATKPDGTPLYDDKARIDARNVIYMLEDAMLTQKELHLKQDKFNKFLGILTIMFWDHGTKLNTYYAISEHEKTKYAVAQRNNKPAIITHIDRPTKLARWHKATQLRMRQVNISGETKFAMQFENNKAAEQIGIKARRKDEKPEKAAEDLTRLTWVTINLNDAPLFKNRLQKIVELLGGTVEFYREKDFRNGKTNGEGNHGSSQDWRAYKFNAKINGLPELEGLDIEIIILDVEGYINSQYKLGEAHTETEVRRLMSPPQNVDKVDPSGQKVTVNYNISPLRLMLPEITSAEEKNLRTLELHARWKRLYDLDYQDIMKNNKGL